MRVHLDACRTIKSPRAHIGLRAAAALGCWRRHGGSFVLAVLVALQHGCAAAPAPLPPVLAALPAATQAPAPPPTPTPAAASPVPPPSPAGRRQQILYAKRLCERGMSLFHRGNYDAAQRQARLALAGTLGWEAGC